MWIEDTQVCQVCGSEVTLYTDGRWAYALTGETGPGAMRIEADTQGDDIFRESNGTLTVLCPAYERDDSGNRCHATLIFTGEGMSAREDVSAFAQPIQEM